MSIKILCNTYLGHQESRVAIGEITLSHVSDQISLLRSFVRFVSPNRQVSSIATPDLQNYRRKLIKAGKSANIINNRIAVIKALYNWALDNEVIDSPPKLRAVKKITIKRQDKPTFTMSQVRKSLQNASPQMQAMIRLGLNCGPIFG